jgi:hypothetical protein
MYCADLQYFQMSMLNEHLIVNAHNNVVVELSTYPD